MLSHLRALRARFIRNIKSLRGTNTTRVNDNHSVVFEPFLRLVITASSSNQKWTWRSQHPHPVTSSQCQEGLTQILSPLIIAFCCGNLHKQFNLLLVCSVLLLRLTTLYLVTKRWSLTYNIPFHWNLMVASKLNVGPSSSIDSMLFKFQLVLVVIVNIDVSIVKKFKQTPHLAGCVAGEGGEGYGHQEEE